MGKWEETGQEKDRWSGRKGKMVEVENSLKVITSSSRWSSVVMMSENGRRNLSTDRFLVSCKLTNAHLEISDKMKRKKNSTSTFDLW